MQTLTLIAFYLALALPPMGSPVCDSIKESGKTAVREEPSPSLNTTAAEIYYFHPDHLGSSAWVTDTLGVAVQHLAYLPWGEPYVTQKTGNFNPTYTFSGKERDEETGYSYFGQRFYDSQLSLWISVDPMRGKYPSLSPFVYCANNPIRLVDPNGMEIEYNSFADRIIVFFSRIFNKDFRNHFKTLKKSEETYVFKKNNEGFNDFTTDGDKLYINYSINDTYKAEGQTIYSNLRHETTHGIQFEYGELGFKNIGEGTWIPISYDLTDELEAHNNQNGGFSWRTIYGSSREWWNREGTTDEDRMNVLQKTYPDILPFKLYNPEKTDRIKNEQYYLRPHQSRPVAGKSFSNEGDKLINIDYEHLVIGYHWIYIFRNDTVFEYHIYDDCDSVVIDHYEIVISKNLSIRYFNDGTYCLSKWKKQRIPSEIFNIYKNRYFLESYEVRYVKKQLYSSDGKLLSYSYVLGNKLFHKTTKEGKILSNNHVLRDL